MLLSQFWKITNAAEGRELIRRRRGVLFCSRQRNQPHSPRCKILWLMSSRCFLSIMFSGVGGRRESLWTSGELYCVVIFHLSCCIGAACSSSASLCLWDVCGPVYAGNQRICPGDKLNVKEEIQKKRWLQNGVALGYFLLWMYLNEYRQLESELTLALGQFAVTSSEL